MSPSASRCWIMPPSTVIFFCRHGLSANEVETVLRMGLAELLTTMAMDENSPLHEGQRAGADILSNVLRVR